MRNLPVKCINYTGGVGALVEDMRVNTNRHPHLRYILTVLESSSGGGHLCTSPYMSYYFWCYDSSCIARTILHIPTAISTDWSVVISDSVTNITHACQDDIMSLITEVLAGCFELSW